jgi:peptidoglycan biosynthesis protein MviN/MurJ (putative lipid II flippase)
MFGFVGPAIATLVTTLLSAIYLLWATAKATEISFEKVFPWKKIWNITMINICYGLAFAIIKKVLPLEDIFNEVLESVVLGLIWGIIYFSTNYKLLRTKWEVLNNN